MTEETWRSVVGYVGLYEVSDLGRVRSLHHYSRVLAGGRQPSGRRYVSLYRDKTATTRTVARLVLEAFVGPRPAGMVGCHNDGDCKNDAAANLRWDSQQGNCEDRSRHGTHRSQKKQRCPRGHLLRAPNLSASAAQRGRRFCLACHRAHARVSQAASREVSLDLREVADSYYGTIMTGEEDVPAPEEETSPPVPDDGPPEETSEGEHFCFRGHPRQGPNVSTYDGRRRCVACQRAANQVKYWAGKGIHRDIQVESDRCFAEIWAEPTSDEPPDDDGELWRPIPGWDDLYEVSDLGRVRSLSRVILQSDGTSRRFPGRVLATKRRKNRDNRGTVMLCRAGRQVTTPVATLVLTAFVGPRPAGFVACHSNGDPTDDRAVNLRWDSYSGNNRDTVLHGNNVARNRQRCSLGHLLRHPNLSPAELARGHRRCMACNRGRARLKWAERKGVDLGSLQSVADDYYAKIMTTP